MRRIIKNRPEIKPYNYVDMTIASKVNYRPNFSTVTTDLLSSKASSENAVNIAKNKSKHIGNQSTVAKEAKNFARLASNSENDIPESIVKSKISLRERNDAKEQNDTLSLKSPKAAAMRREIPKAEESKLQEQLPFKELQSPQKANKMLSPGINNENSNIKIKMQNKSSRNIFIQSKDDINSESVLQSNSINKSSQSINRKHRKQAIKNISESNNIAEAEETSEDVKLNLKSKLSIKNAFQVYR